MTVYRNKDGRKPRMTDKELLDVFRSASALILSPVEVADAVPIKRRGTLNRLQALEEDGELESKQIGGRHTVWGLADEAAVSDTKMRAPVTTDAVPVNVERDTPLEVLGSDGFDDPLKDIDFPAGRDREEWSDAVNAARDYLRDYGPTTKRNLVAAEMPEHPLGYGVDDALEKVATGDSYRGAWWRRVVKPGSKALPDVEMPAQVVSDWREVQA
jgi:hypothetical protein